MCSCSTPNPLDCSDGLCSDPAHPFCDVDGSFGPTTNTCVAVSCAPGETAKCRGDVAIVCNTNGNDYDLVSCERGCDPMFGCRQCTSNDECANPSPVCDATSSSCRACNSDDECTSKVCDNGSCLSETGILYAAPNGTDTSSCTLAQPCTIDRVQMLALSGSVPPLVRLLPGVYAVGIDIAKATSAPVRIVATGATLSGQSPIHVSEGANVKIRSVTAIGSYEVVLCGSTTSSLSKLSISDSLLRAGSTSAPVLDVGHAGANDGRCEVTLSATDLDIGGSTGSGIFLSSNAVVLADRVRMHGNAIFTVGAFGDRVAIRVTNSILDNVGFTWTTGDTGPPGSSIAMGFNTIHVDQIGLNCQSNSGSAYRVSRYENNIVYGTNVVSAVEGTDCMLSHNVLYPFTGAAGTNIVADPQLLDVANRDYHLKTTSPAIDAAVPTTLVATPDFEGTQRPQGTAPDIGAFESHP